MSTVTLSQTTRAAHLPMLLLVAMLGAPAVAEPLPEPEGEVVLTISGRIEFTNADGTARFDRAMLEALPQTSFTTGTIWTEGRSEFTGVELDDLLARVGAEGETLHAMALNDYKVDVPVSDARDGGPILAYRMDGEHMTTREKGPLWIVYPFDDNPDYRSEVIYSRSIWQLDRIQVLE